MGQPDHRGFHHVMVARRYGFRKPASSRACLRGSVVLCALWSRSAVWAPPKPQKVAYRSFLDRSAALLSPRVDSSRPIASPTRRYKALLMGMTCPFADPRYRQTKEPECYDDG